MTFQLSKDELRQFQEVGFVGPYRLFEPETVDCITRELVAEKSKFFFFNRILSRIPVLKNHLKELRWRAGRWHKGIHAISSKIYQISKEPAVLDRVASIVGDNVILWGSLVLTIKPSDNPGWHVDAECRDWELMEGASVWVALSNVDEDSCMRVITRSHNLSASPEDLGKRGTPIVNDNAAIEAAKQLDPQCECISVNTKPGEFFIFAKGLWHTGKKTNKVRNSLLLQYAKPDTTVRIPASFDYPVVWDTRPVPCVLVKGQSSPQVSKSLDDQKILVKPPI
jgi:hypothetical protein